MIGWGSVGQGPAAELANWLKAQSQREAKAVRLEDALLGDHFARYFAYRLRYFSIRTAVALVLHAVKILLLFNALPSQQFAIIVALGACVTIGNDFWWGGLERMRQRIREFRHDGAMHRLPHEIGSWIALAIRFATVGVVLALCWMVYRSLTGGLGAIDLYAGALGISFAAGLIVRTYHSGAYALRRIYRPVASFIVPDVLGLALLALLLPRLDAWALPISETVTIGTVLAFTFYYTSRTYRVLGIENVVLHALKSRQLPTLGLLRATLLPAVAYATVGIESIILLALVASSAGATASASLLSVVAALGPLIRAGFEWAQLLYFDLIRLGVPVLRGLQHRFDTATTRLAGIIGLFTWALAAGVSVAVLGARDVEFLGALLPFFLTRSFFAAFQVRAFTAGSYRRLSSVGILIGLSSFAILRMTVGEAEQLLFLSALLATSFMALLTLARPTEGTDRTMTLPDWLRRLSSVPGPVTVSCLRFDTRTLARGVTADQWRTEAWRRAIAGRHFALEVARNGGAATWFDPYQLAWFGPENKLPSIMATGGGLVKGRSAFQFPTGQAAADELLHSSLGVEAATVLPSVQDLVAEFKHLFPTEISFEAERPSPASLKTLTSHDRAEVLRAAIQFAGDSAPFNQLRRWDVTALAGRDGLIVIFVIDRRRSRSARERWAGHVRRWNLRNAALGGERRKPLPNGQFA